MIFSSFELLIDINRIPRAALYIDGREISGVGVHDDIGHCYVCY